MCGLMDTGRAVLALSEAARCLGVAQAKGDAPAMKHWQEKVKELEATARSGSGATPPSTEDGATARAGIEPAADAQADDLLVITWSSNGEDRHDVAWDKEEVSTRMSTLSDAEAASARVVTYQNGAAAHRHAGATVMSLAARAYALQADAMRTTLSGLTIGDTPIGDWEVIVCRPGAAQPGDIQDALASSKRNMVIEVLDRLLREAPLGVGHIKNITEARAIVLELGLATTNPAQNPNTARGD